MPRSASVKTAEKVTTIVCKVLKPFQRYLTFEEQSCLSADKFLFFELLLMFLHSLALLAIIDETQGYLKPNYVIGGG